MGERASVVVVDDHALFRLGVAQAIASSVDFAVVGEGDSAAQAIELAATLEPDLVLLDISMPGDGVAAIERIRTESPKSRVIMLTVSEEEHDVLRALEAGVSGYVLKGTPAPQLLSIMASVARGESYVAPNLAVRLLSTIRTTNEADRTKELLGSLSPKERLTLRLISDGLSNREIANAMGIQAKTAQFHVSNVLQKLGLRNRVQAAIFGQRHQITNVR